MTEQKRRRSRFLPGFLLYLLFLGLLLGALLFVFRDFLRVYEATRPERALEQLQSDFAAHRFGEGCREAVSALGLTLQSEEEAMTSVSALLEDADFVEDVEEELKGAFLAYAEHLVGHAPFRPYFIRASGASEPGV